MIGIDGRGGSNLAPAINPDQSEKHSAMLIAELRIHASMYLNTLKYKY
jgi:hypothetical protein